MAKPVFIARFNWGEDEEGIYCHVLLTMDEEEAKEHNTNYKLASLDDLNNWSCVQHEPFNGWLQTTDGIVTWRQNVKEEKYGYEVLNV